MPTPEAFLGQDTTTWTGWNALATVLLAVLTFGSFVLVWRQLREAKRATVSGTLERASNRLASARADIWELIALEERDGSLGFEQIASLRNAVFSYEAFLPTLEVAARNLDRVFVSSIFLSYLEDFLLIARVLQHGMSVVKERSEKVDADLGKALDRLLDELKATPEERVRAHALRGEHSEQFDQYIDVLTVRALTAKGLSAEAIISGKPHSAVISNRERSKFLASTGGDPDNYIARGALLAELERLFDRLVALNDDSERVARLLGLTTRKANLTVPSNSPSAVSKASDGDSH